MTALAATHLAIAARLNPTDLSVTAGQMVALIGPNGGGKTSLLRAIARVERAAGTVLINDEDLDSLGEARRRKLVGFVPASRDVGWPIAARDVIALGLARRDEARIAELIGLFELELFADRPINDLSTGERARVLLARGLAARPAVVLLDEPLANLEPYWVLRLLKILRGEASKGTAILVALHDLGQLRAFDRALLIADGRLQLDETPAGIIASERFEVLFRVVPDGTGWTISRSADRRSLP